MDSKHSVSRRSALTLLGGGILAAGQAFASPKEAEAPALDPKGLVRPELLQAAIAAAADKKITDRSRLLVMDFKRHSSKPRLYLVDRSTGIVEAMNCAHGIGSDARHCGYASVFSNVPNTSASSLGAYRIVGMGQGPKHGPHLALDGLEPSNDKARERAIIIHSAWYAEPDRVREWGKMGRSNGCFATSDADRDRLFAALKPGTLLFAGA
ncbi:MAG: murein L,D-transpeptidase catalytic domain-containing protein [Caulobacterales bacterium]